MKKQNRLAWLWLALLVGLLTITPAHAFYNPQTGHWINRDPLADIIFLNKITKPMPLTQKQRMTLESLKPLFDLLGNNPVNNYDYFGLAADDVNWTPNDSTCPNGSYVTFAQVGYNGGPMYKTPFVDDGSVGFKGEPTGCIEYPNFGSPGVFSDSPGPGVVIGAVEFVTCQLCVSPCNCFTTKSRTPYSGRKIVHVGPCKKWSFGYKGNLSNAPDATPAEMAIWTAAINSFNPSINPLGAQCYSCNKSQPLN
jgi:hypothetical protein